MQGIHQGDAYMYLFDHLNKMSELLVHGLFVVPCGKQQVAGVDKVFWCRHLILQLFFHLVMSKVRPPDALFPFLQTG